MCTPTLFFILFSFIKQDISLDKPTNTMKGSVNNTYIFYNTIPIDFNFLARFSENRTLYFLSLGQPRRFVSVYVVQDKTKIRCILENHPWLQLDRPPASKWVSAIRDPSLLWLHSSTFGPVAFVESVSHAIYKQHLLG